MPNFSPTIIFAGGSGTTFLVILFLLIKYPDHVQKWIGMLSRGLNFVFKKTEYFTTKWEIEGKLNSFASNLETDGGVPYNRIKIQWTARSEDQEIAFEDGETIIVMRDRNHRNKNFVHAAYFYTSEILLQNTKRKLPKHLKTSIDLYATEKIIQKENKATLNQFITDFLIPNVDKEEKIKDYIEKFQKIDNLGLFFCVLIQELTYLGSKVYLSTKTEEIVKEVEGLIQFLVSWAEREVGQKIAEEFIGQYTKCSIKIVASAISRELNKTDQQKNRLLGTFKAGCENIYVIGNEKSDSKKFINDVIDKLTEEMSQLRVVKRLGFTARINREGKKIQVKDYLVHVRNPDAVEYINE